MSRTISSSGPRCNIRAGAKFIGTNSDRTFPNPEGIVPGNGALLAAIETATDVKPIVIGKPEPVLYQMSLKSMNAVPEQTLVLGDRLETDILGAVRLESQIGAGAERRHDARADWRRVITNPMGSTKTSRL